MIDIPILETNTHKLNPNLKVRNAILNRLQITEGYCPCNQGDTPKEDTKCPCRSYRENNYCCCNLYTKI